MTMYYLVLILLLIVRAIMVAERRMNRANLHVRSVIARGAVVDQLCDVSFKNNAGCTVRFRAVLPIRKELLTMTANRTTTLFTTPCRGVIGGVIEDPPDPPDEEDDESIFIIDKC